MSTIAAPDRSPATSSRSASALNLIGGTWVEGRGNTSRDIYNPADTAEMLAPVREAAPEQVDEACAAAARAFPGWRATPAPDRAHVLFKFRELLEKNFSDVAHSIVRENGKLLSEARGSLRRGLDVVDFACGIPSQMMGQTLTDVSRDVDCLTIREPMGVVVGIPPFNFPALIPLWMMSVAVACGNTFLLKPAEKAPLTGTRLVEMFADAGLPPGVVGVVQGSKEVSERLIANPHVQAVSFVGTSAVAESVYRTAAAHGKRVQAHGGAKNHLLVLPDADLERILPDLIGSCFGSAGQRCLAGSVLVAVGDRVRQDAVVDAFIRAAGELKLGDGLDDAATLCPVVNPDRGKADPGCDRARGGGRSPASPRRPFPNRTPQAAGLLHRADGLRRCDAGDVRRPGGDLRPGGERDARPGPGRGDHVDEPQPIRQHGLPLHAIRGGGPHLPRTHPGRDARHQCRRAGADGVLSVRRLEGFDLRISQYAGC